MSINMQFIKLFPKSVDGCRLIFTIVSNGHMRLFTKTITFEYKISLQFKEDSF